MSPALAGWFFTISTTWEAHAGHISLFHHIFLNWMLDIINFTFWRTRFYCFKIVRVCLADKLFGDKINPFKLGVYIAWRQLQRLIECCQENALVITNTLLQQHKRRLYTWTSPDGQHRNQIDYILCSQRWISCIQSAKTRPGVDCGSDHELLIAKFRLKLKKVGKTTRPFRDDLNQIPYDYTVEVRNRFQGLDLIENCFSHVRLFATPWTVAHQASLSRRFSRQEYWSGLPCLSPEDLPNPGTELKSVPSPALAGIFFTTSTTWETLES